MLLFFAVVSDSAMEKAKAYLVKRGWTPGKGLGKNEQGRAVHLRVSRKNDHKGIGDNAKDKYTPWWEKMYNSTAQALTERIASTSPPPATPGVSPTPSPAPVPAAQPPAKKARVPRHRASASDSDSSSSDSDSDSEAERELAQRLREPVDEVVLRRPKAVRLYGTAFAPRFVRGETLVATMPDKAESPSKSENGSSGGAGASADKTEGGCSGEKTRAADAPTHGAGARPQGFVPMPGASGEHGDSDSSSSSSSDSDSDSDDGGRPISTSDATFERLGGSRCKKYSSEAKLRRLAAQEAAWKRRKLLSASPTPSPQPQ